MLILFNRKPNVKRCSSTSEKTAYLSIHVCLYYPLVNVKTFEECE